MTARSGSGGSGSRRSYLSDAVKAAAHPTRREILKALEKDDLTTVELEESTGENRYHLYHHLSVLEENGLVASRVVGKAKEFSLRKPRKPDVAYLEFRRDDRGERPKLEALLKVVGEIAEDQVPNLNRVTRVRLMFSYPWSPDEES